MTTELTHLTVVTLATSVMWIPYILDAMVVRGIMPTLANPRDDAVPLHPWAVRAKRAHANAIENLVVFAALVFAAHLAGVHSKTTTTATSLYLWARLVHFAVYTAGAPVVRTLAFLAGFAAQAMLVVALLS